MVVLTIPIDEGWTLYSVDSNNQKEEVEIIKAQGGFIGFVGQEGEMSYLLEYETPGLEYGVYGLSIGIFLLGVLYVGFELSNQDKKTLKKQLAL